ncbi:MAG TPA: ATP-binding protein [Burkholderiaceae bacterium]|nr:ATP-binding protein [Burkholderiaceae bacterium]
MLAAPNPRTGPAPSAGPVDAARPDARWADADAATLRALRDWVEHAPDPVALVDAAGRMRRVNPAFERAFGAPERAGALPSPVLARFVPLLTPPRLARWLAEADPDGAPRVHRLMAEGVSADGERFLVAATLLRTDPGPEAGADAPRCLVTLRPLDAPRGLLATDAAERGAQPGRAPDAVGVHALVDATLRSLAPADRRRRIELALHAPRAALAAEPESLRHALLQVVTNALRYSSPDTPVSIRSRHDACDEAEWIVLVVSDRGPGLSRAQQQRAFEPFWRAPTAFAHPGQGMGLPTARRLVDAAGGWIELKSVPGVGTEVELWLPGAAAPLDA